MKLKVNVFVNKINLLFFNCNKIVACEVGADFSQYYLFLYIIRVSKVNVEFRLEGTLL